VKFERALPHLRKGKLIGRKHWPPHQFWYAEGRSPSRPPSVDGDEDLEFLVYRPLSTDETHDPQLVVAYLRDILADDWVVRERKMKNEI